MSDRSWPATQKQRNYGIALEDQLGFPRSKWREMTVDEAKDRIGMLVELRDIERAKQAPMALDELI
jgi:hypothetical protein